MKNVSFGSVYAIPHDKTQNPVNKNYVNFLTETAVLRDKSQKSKYDAMNDIYYVYIRDENDKKFEDYASKYGISYRKANQAELNNVVTISGKNSPADRDLNFMMRAIQMGARYETCDDGKFQNVTLYDDKGENVFAKFTIDKSKGCGGKLIKKEEMLDGQTDCIHEYDDNGRYKRSILIYSDNTKLEFTYDESGKAIMKK